jgi:hypothetical protein
MPERPPAFFDGWRLDIDPIWESYNRILFSYRRSEVEKEAYLKRLYRSHFVVFTYSFIDAMTTQILIQKFKFSKSQLSHGSLKSKVGRLDAFSKNAGALAAFHDFWTDDIHTLRTELIHPKRYDHWVSTELDKLDIETLLIRLNLFAVKAHQVSGMEFPYWLTGWNSINSMTSDSASQGIIQSNNSQFKVFLQMCGWLDSRHSSQALESVKDYLVGEEKYKAVVSFLDALGFETQPLPTGVDYSLMPLWSKQWWDRSAMEKLRAFRMSNSPFNRK